MPVGMKMEQLLVGWRGCVQCTSVMLKSVAHLAGLCCIAQSQCFFTKLVHVFVFNLPYSNFQNMVQSSGVFLSNGKTNLIVHMFSNMIFLLSLS